MSNPYSARNERFQQGWVEGMRQLCEEREAAGLPELPDGVMMELALLRVRLAMEGNEHAQQMEHQLQSGTNLAQHMEKLGEAKGQAKGQAEGQAKGQAKGQAEGKALERKKVTDARHKDNRADHEAVNRWLDENTLKHENNASQAARIMVDMHLVGAKEETIRKWAVKHLGLQGLTKVGRPRKATI